MPAKNRINQIEILINERGYISVYDLSKIFKVSEMTIRRDLELLQQSNRIRRTFGGAYTLFSENKEKQKPKPLSQERSEVLLVDQVDVLIGSSVNAYFDGLLVDRAKKKNIPIIAESISMPNQSSIVAVDNYRAGFDLGCWAGNHLRQKNCGKIYLLDLTFHQPNTQERSRGFAEGLNETYPDFEIVLSMNAQSRFASAYQFAKDALAVFPHTNLIFAINDITAWGAINACRDLGINPEDMTIITFGLEGDTMKNEMMGADSYCKAGLAMFPEIVGMTCLEAAILAYNRISLSEKYITPHIVLTPESLPNYYNRIDNQWKLNWPLARKNLKIPLEFLHGRKSDKEKLPRQIGMIVPFIEHEWYQNLVSIIQDQCGQYGITLKVIDADQNVSDEVDLRRHQIAVKAADLIKPGEVVLVDGGSIALYLARAEEEERHHGNN